MSIRTLLLVCVAIVAIIAVLFLGVLCVVCGFTAPYFDPLGTVKTYDASHAGADHVTVDIRSGTLGGGDVKILRSHDDTIIVKASIDTRSPEYVGADIAFTESEDDLRLEVRTNSGTDELFNFRGSRSSIEVYLPENTSCDVSVFTFSGDVYVCPIEGGSLIIEDPPYRQYGHITIEGGNYTSIYVKSDEYMANSGGLVIAKYNSTNAYFETAGDIEIDTLQTGGRLKATSRGGNIRVTLPDQAMYELKASADGGQVKSDMPGTTRNNQSDLLLELRTSGGDVIILHGK